MKKVIKWGALALVLVLVVGLTITYYKLSSIVVYAVETQGTKQMNLATDLEDASVGLLRGEVGLDDLKIANPPGFTAPHLFSLDGLDVKAPIGRLRENPKRISAITLDKPTLVIERGADGRFNFKAAIDQMPKGPAPTEPAPAPTDPAPAGDEMKLIIDELTIKDAVVVVRPGINLPGIAQEITVPIPTVVMKNIGNAEGAQNGAAMRDVAQQVITVMAASASNSNLLPADLRGLLNLDVNAVVAELGTRLGAEAQKRIAAALPGELGARLGQAVADPKALLDDPNKAVDAVRENAEKALRDRGVPGNLDEVKKDPAKALERLPGLLGGGGGKRDRERERDKANTEPAPADQK